MRKFISLSIIIYFLFPFTSALQASEVLNKSVSNHNLLAQRRRGNVRTTNSPNSNNNTWINRGRRSGQLNLIHQQQQQQRQLPQNSNQSPHRKVTKTNSNSNRKRVVSPTNSGSRKRAISPTNSNNSGSRRRAVSPVNNGNSRSSRKRVVSPTNNNSQRSHRHQNRNIEQNNHNRSAPTRYPNTGKRRSINPTVNSRSRRHRTTPHSNYPRKKIDRNYNYNYGHRRIHHPYVSRRNWGWYGGRRWYPNYKYWGGGFWGSFIVSPTIRIIRQQNDSYDSYNSYSKFTNSRQIEQNAPGDELFNSYQLNQVRCDVNQDLVFVYGPGDTLMCAIPNENVPAGQYYIDLENLSLVVRE